MIDATDILLAAHDPTNSLENRSIRILDEKIATLEQELAGLKFVRETLADLNDRH